MNTQEEIEEYLNDLLEQTEEELDRVFAERLKTILNQLAEMHRKYSKDGVISRTEMYKYKRFEKEMQFIKDNMQEHYAGVYTAISGLMVSQYRNNYMHSAHLYEIAAKEDMGYQIPSVQTIKEIISNPIKELTLPKILTQHRNEIIRNIRIEIAQGIQAGESYSEMAARLEQRVEFSRQKARRVARTEAGRAQTLGRLKSIEQAKKYAETDEFWMAELDKKTRKAHRKLDGQERGEDGLFHYKGMKAPGPSLWGVASMDINCRCDIGTKINGMFPNLRRARDYDNADYQRKLAKKIDEIMADEGKTEKQATRKAKRLVYPPNKVIDYINYDEWYKSLKDKG